MADARPASLLDFAIVASIGVVPVLLGVLVGLERLAPTPYGDDARHVSVRQVAALRTFEHAIVRRDSVSAGVPDAAALGAYVPACSHAWNRADRAIDRIATWIGRVPEVASTPATRLVAQLRTIDAALARMSAPGNRRVADPVGLDVARWAEAAQATLAMPIETPLYPARRFQLSCADLASAAAALARHEGRALASLAWRGTEVQRTVSQWRDGQYVAISERHFARSNPWAGLPGCVYLFPKAGDTARPAYFVKGTRSVNERVCSAATLVAGATSDHPHASPGAIVGEPGDAMPTEDARWQVPPSLQAMLRPLESLQRPTGALYRLYATGDAASPARPQRLSLAGADVDVGYSVDLTIDPALQALAQRTAACYTGRQDVCRALGIRRAEDGDQPVGHRLLERAVVRMAAIAIVDVASGRIEALAGALSRCTRHEFDGPGRAADCDARMPYPIRYRPDALMNPAVYHDAMPASLVKPVMAAAFLSNAAVGARWLASERAAMRSAAPPTTDTLRGQLMRSMSARFLDRMFCGDRGFGRCERPWEIQSASVAFGWNGGCASADERCGRRDLLFGRPVGADAEREPLVPATWVPYGRLMVEPSYAKPGAAFRERPAIALNDTWVRRCAAGADGRRGSDDDWEKCSGGVVVDVVAEGWGQGHARATALGAAGMMATLAAAANGQAEVRGPHLVRALRGIAGAPPAALAEDHARWTAAAREPVRVGRDVAEVILSGLLHSHRQGTARRACEQVFDARACRVIDWIAGKTGTPTFPNDGRTLDELATLCAPGARRTAAEETACGGLRPYKWYVAAYRGPADAGWTKAIAVLTERNWLADSGRVHGAGDHGPNPAAEIALQVAGRDVGALGDAR